MPHLSDAFRLSEERHSRYLPWRTGDSAGVLPDPITPGGGPTSLFEVRYINPDTFLIVAERSFLLPLCCVKLALNRARAPLPGGSLFPYQVTRISKRIIGFGPGLTSSDEYYYIGSHIFK